MFGRSMAYHFNDCGKPAASLDTPQRPFGEAPLDSAEEEGAIMANSAWYG
jgi:hypothetical protein